MKIKQTIETNVNLKATTIRLMKYSTRARISNQKTRGTFFIRIATRMTRNQCSSWLWRATGCIREGLITTLTCRLLSPSQLGKFWTLPNFRTWEVQNRSWFHQALPVVRTTQKQAQLMKNFIYQVLPVWIYWPNHYWSQSLILKILNRFKTWPKKFNH